MPWCSASQMPPKPRPSLNAMNSRCSAYKSAYGRRQAAGFLKSNPNPKRTGLVVTSRRSRSPCAEQGVRRIGFLAGVEVPVRCRRIAVRREVPVHLRHHASIRDPPLAVAALQLIEVATEHLHRSPVAVVVTLEHEPGVVRLARRAVAVDRDREVRDVMRSHRAAA